MTLPAHPPARTRNRLEIPHRFQWNPLDIVQDWGEWEAALAPLEKGIERHAPCEGTPAVSWFSPERLDIPRETGRRWMDEVEDLRLYRFAIEDLDRQQ